MTTAERVRELTTRLKNTRNADEQLAIAKELRQTARELRVAEPPSEAALRNREESRHYRQGSRPNGIRTDEDIEIEPSPAQETVAPPFPSELRPVFRALLAAVAHNHLATETFVALLDDSHKHKTIIDAVYFQYRNEALAQRDETQSHELVRNAVREPICTADSLTLLDAEAAELPPASAVRFSDISTRGMHADTRKSLEDILRQKDYAKALRFAILYYGQAPAEQEAIETYLTVVQTVMAAGYLLGEHNEALRSSVVEKLEQLSTARSEPSTGIEVPEAPAEISAEFMANLQKFRLDDPASQIDQPTDVATPAQSEQPPPGSPPPARPPRGMSRVGVAVLRPRIEAYLADGHYQRVLDHLDDYYLSPSIQSDEDAISFYISTLETLAVHNAIDAADFQKRRNEATEKLNRLQATHAEQG